MRDGMRRMDGEGEEEGRGSSWPLELRVESTQPPFEEGQRMTILESVMAVPKPTPTQPIWESGRERLKVTRAWVSLESRWRAKGGRDRAEPRMEGEGARK